MKKEDSIKLVSNMEKLAKRLVIITTPNGFTSGKVVNGNILQLHMCGYTIKELKQLGYKVRGIGVKIPGYFQYNMVRIATYPLRIFTWFIPRLSYDLIAIKHMKNAQ